jgi:glutaconate CoA-transferase subunit A
LKQIERKSVVSTIEEAAQQIEDGMTIAIGGFSITNHPMPIVRQMIKNGVKNLTVIGAATGGLEIDMLIGAGAVRKLICPYVGGESYAPIGHCFRHAVENRLIELWECSEYTLYAGLQAQAMGQGFMPWRGGIGSSLPELNPDFKLFRDPIHNEEYLAVPAIGADWAIIHVGIADQYGNGQHLGARFGDRLLARAATRVMLVAEHFVPNRVIRQDPYRTSIGYADIVVEARFASHPFAAHAFYQEDAEQIRSYVAASMALRKGDRSAFEAYLGEWVYGPENHEAYLAKVGATKLMALEKAYTDLRRW